MSKKPKLKTINYKLITIVGPTASGKSELAVKIAKKFDGEIISADSRQVYKGMDVGTGKVTPDTKNSSNFSTGQVKKKYIFTHKGIPHYCIDVASPKRKFTVAQYQKLALKAINKVFKKGKPRTTFHKNALEKPETKKVVRGKIPILCGGTGFYIQAVVDGIIIPEVKPDWRLRSGLEQLSTEELFNRLKKLDQKRAKTIDKKNRRRLIRAIEIVMKTKKPVPALKKNPLPYPVLMIGIKKEKKELSSLIKKRFFQWLKKGLILEVINLKKSGLSWEKIEEFGLHYRQVSQYLQKKITYQEMIENSLKELQNYAKKQMTWFKRDKRISWIKNYKEAEKLVKEFLKKIGERFSLSPFF